MTTGWVKALTIALMLFNATKSFANDIFLEAYGDSIELSLIQKNGQDNNIDIYANGNNNSISIVQDGSYNIADVTQTGPEPTTTTINQTGDNFNTTVTQYCNTQGGCSVTVTQY